MTFDPKLTWAVVVALAIQAAAGLIWTGSAAARLAAVEHRLVAAEPAIERLIRVEEQIAQSHAGIARIEARLDARCGG